MKVIVRPRQMGKTTELIRMSNETGHVIVVPFQKFVERVERLAIKHDIPIKKPMTIAKLKECQDDTIKGVLIDNADYILRDLIGAGRYEIKAITIDGLPNEKFYDERESYMEYERLTYQEFCELKYGVNKCSGEKI